MLGGVNEFQVSAGSSSGDHCLKEEVKKVSPRHSTAIGDYRTTIALQRAKTAREAIEIMADLTEKYGARTDNYVLADPNEAWLWEEFQDRRWIAVRVPDDSFIVEANNRRISNIDLEDTGDQMSYADAGLAVNDPPEGQSYSWFVQIFMHAGSGGDPNLHYQYYQNPITLQIELYPPGSDLNLFLPLVLSER